MTKSESIPAAVETCPPNQRIFSKANENFRDGQKNPKTSSETNKGGRTPDTSSVAKLTSGVIPCRRQNRGTSRVIQENQSFNGANEAEQIPCQFYLRTATCAYADRCKFYHPPNQLPPELNELGYPVRKGTKECSFYLKYGICGYGATCKYDHPKVVGRRENASRLSLDNGVPSSVQYSPQWLHSAPALSVNAWYAPTAVVGTCCYPYYVPHQSCVSGINASPLTYVYNQLPSQIQQKQYWGFDHERCKDELPYVVTISDSSTITNDDSTGPYEEKSEYSSENERSLSL